MTSTVRGGQVLAGNTVTLSGAAPPGGAVVEITSSNPAAASGPASITLPEGQIISSAFNVDTQIVPADTEVVFTATYNGSSKTKTITVQASSLTSVELIPSTVVGGTTSTANRLNFTFAPQSPVTINLTSSNPALATVPPAVILSPPNSFVTFNISTSATPDFTPVTITATSGVSVKTAVLTVGPVGVSGVTLSQSNVAGGLTIGGNLVNLSGNALAGGAVVNMSSSNPALVSVPATVTVPGGASSAQFSFTTGVAAAATSVTITATLGTTVQTATVTVGPTALISMSAPASLISGASSNAGLVTLNGPAPAGGITVALSSSNTAAATVPASVVVPQGASSANFTVTAAPTVSAVSTTITASYDGVTRTATVNVAPATLVSLLMSSQVVGGNTTTNSSVTINAPASAGGVTVNLASNNAALTVPPTVVIPEGQSSTTFTVNTTPVSTTAVVTVTATLGSTTRTATVNVQPLQVSHFTMTQSSVGGGGTVLRNYVQLNALAPSGGVTVNLSSSHPGVLTVPASIVIPAGSGSAAFTISTTPVGTAVPVTITATYGTSSKTTVFTVDIIRLLSFAMFETGKED
ncbi:MAG: hypothetical protein FJW40_02995 [Acidobacteria bacterium]|nr:hypothetical protein [Acidobacteriota bacterium]